MSLRDLKKYLSTRKKQIFRVHDYGTPSVKKSTVKIVSGCYLKSLRGSFLQHKKKYIKSDGSPGTKACKFTNCYLE